MKLFKRVSCLALAATMTLLLCVGASAVVAAVSSQKIEVDGVPIEKIDYNLRNVQPFNIAGSNYFKLRDVACMLNGTRVQFDVGYDAARNAITVTTGKSYKKQEGDLAAPFKQNITKDAVESAQTFFIDGKRTEGIKAYNIDGSNYFMLRDLGKALDFGVEFNAKRNIIEISTAEREPDITFTALDVNGTVWTDKCFAQNKLTLLVHWAYWNSGSAKAMLALQKVQEQYAAQGVLILALCDEKDKQESAEFFEKNGVTIPCLIYTEELDRYLAQNPSAALVNSKGLVLKTCGGEKSYDEWVKLIDENMPA